MFHTIESDSPPVIVIVATGVSLSSTSLTPSEVLNLSNEDSKCEEMSFDHRLNYAFGGYLFGNVSTPVVCGGFDSTISARSNKCYSIISSQVLATMIINRNEGASVALDNGRTLWVTGGLDSDYHMSKPTNIIAKTEFVAYGSSHPGPNLPMSLKSHCIVKINASSAIIIGGNADDKRQGGTWIVNSAAQSWTKGPDLITGRELHSCGLITDLRDGSKMVIAAGGWNHLDRTQSTEIWHLDSKNFIDGPLMPTATSSASGVMSPDGKTFFVIGGVNRTNIYTTNIHSLQCFNKNCQWKTMKQKLRVGRYGAVAMLIPKSQAKCT